MPSAPSRCGQSWRASSRRRSPRRSQQLGDHVLGLGLCPGADRVQHRPAGPDGLGGRLQQGELEVDQPGDVAGAVAPARLGTAAQAAQVGAGRVDQDGVGGAGPQRRAAAVGDHGVEPVGHPQPAGRLGDQPGPAPLDLDGQDPGAEGGQVAGLAPRPGGQVGHQVAGGGADGGGDQGRGGVLDDRPALGDGGQAGRVAPLHGHAVGAERARPGGHAGLGQLGQQLVAGGPAGGDPQADLGPGVVRLDQGDQLPRAQAGQRLLDDPGRVGAAGGGPAGRVALRVGPDRRGRRPGGGARR